MRCTACRQKLVQKSGSRTRLRVKGIVEFGEDGALQAQCFWCGVDVIIPDVKLMKSPEDSEAFVLTPKRVG